MPQLEPREIYQSIEKSLGNRSFAPIYFFHGEEYYLVKQVTQYLKTCVCGQGENDFNSSIFYAFEAEAEKIRDEVETLPVMSDRRWVEVRGVQDLSDRKLEELEAVIKNPVNSTVLVLMGTKVDKRKKMFKWLLEFGLCVEFRRPFENQIPGWIRQICRGKQLEITDAAVQLIHRLVGSQLLEIDREVQKLADFLGERKTIQLEDVAQCVSKRKEENIFDLVGRMASGDRVGSLCQLTDLLQEGQSEVGIIALLARHFRLLYVLQQGMDKGFTGLKLAHHVQVPNYYLPDYVAQLKFWTYPKIESALLILANTDRELKSSPLSSHLWLENLIFEICALTKGFDRDRKRLSRVWT